MTRWLLVMIGALIAATLVEAQAASGWEPVEGRWAAAGAGIPADAPSAGRFSVIGVAVFQGTWTGPSYFTMELEFDPFTGNGHGTMDETLVAVDDKGRSGTLRFLWDLAVTPGELPGTFNFDFTGRIVDATGDFLGARGRLTAPGVGSLASIGSYRGRWKLPRS